MLARTDCGSNFIVTIVRRGIDGFLLQFCAVVKIDIYCCLVLLFCGCFGRMIWAYVSILLYQLFVDCSCCLQHLGLPYCWDSALIWWLKSRRPYWRSFGLSRGHLRQESIHTFCLWVRKDTLILADVIFSRIPQGVEVNFWYEALHRGRLKIEILVRIFQSPLWWLPRGALRWSLLLFITVAWGKCGPWNPLRWIIQETRGGKRVSLLVTVDDSGGFLVEGGNICWCSAGKWCSWVSNCSLLV